MQQEKRLELDKYCVFTSIQSHISTGKFIIYSLFNIKIMLYAVNKKTRGLRHLMKDENWRRD